MMEMICELVELFLVLFNDVFDFLKIDVGRLEIELILFDFVDCLYKVL